MWILMLRSQIVTNQTHVKHKQDTCSNHYQLNFAFENKLETILKYFDKQSKKDESIEEKKVKPRSK